MGPIVPSPRRRVLFVAYTFPPIGGSGVQRTTKFSKYLPQFGWDVSVLTVSGGSVPVWDRTLEKDVPPDTVVRRAPTLEPHYRMKRAAANRGGKSTIPQRAAAVAGKMLRTLLQPDAQVLWLPGAIRDGLRLLSEQPHDAIVATAPPFSCLLVGSLLSQRAKLPLLLDYRDEWSLSNLHYENRRPGPIQSAVQRCMERWAARHAAALVATTMSSAAALKASHVPPNTGRTALCIYNGYDPDDFVNVVPIRPAGNRRFRLVYTGTLWSLMSLEPVVEAVRRLAERNRTILESLELVIAGRRTPEEDHMVAQLRRLSCPVVEHAYVDHPTATGLMLGADALLLVLAERTGADRWVPAKTFEYLAAGRPILACIPDGELKTILAEHSGAFVVTPSHVDEICRWIETAVSDFRDGRWNRHATMDSAKFSRVGQAAELAAALSRLTRKAPISSPAVSGRVATT